MKNFGFLFLIAFFTWNTFAQEVRTDSIRAAIEAEEEFDILLEPVLLEEVIVNREKMDAESLKQFMLLQNRVYKVYPYAKAASERLTMLNTNMAKLRTNKEKKKYFKIVEDYIENEFSDRLKKLSRKQGQILLKLIHRQTGETAFDLIKEHKSGWKAFWSSNTAKLFDLNLKVTYDPYSVNEDYLIETILVRAYEKRRLPFQKAANPIDHDLLTEFWHDKADRLK